MRIFITIIISNSKQNFSGKFYSRYITLQSIYYIVYPVRSSIFFSCNPIKGNLRVQYHEIE